MKRAPKETRKVREVKRELKDEPDVHVFIGNGRAEDLIFIWAKSAEEAREEISKSMWFKQMNFHYFGTLEDLRDVCTYDSSPLGPGDL